MSNLITTMTNFITWSHKLFGHKFIELSIGSFLTHDFSMMFRVKWSRRCDHAGFELELEVWKWLCFLSIYDHRHWDSKKGCWMKLPKSKGKSKKSSKIRK